MFGWVFSEKFAFQFHWNRPISVLLLGTEGSGKTEVGYALSRQPRIDFGSTKGVHVFNVNSKCQHIRLNEIGGSDSVRDIWPHYYNDVRICVD